MEQKRPFPYLQLFGIVCASLLATSILFWVWHVVEFRAIRSEHAAQNESLHSEIRMLEEYVSRAKGGVSGTTSRP